MPCTCPCGGQHTDDKRIFLTGHEVSFNNFIPTETAEAIAEKLGQCGKAYEYILAMEYSLFNYEELLSVGEVVDDGSTRTVGNEAASDTSDVASASTSCEGKRVGEDLPVVELEMALLRASSSGVCAGIAYMLPVKLVNEEKTDGVDGGKYMLRSVCVVNAF